jgi:lipopolysaccharide assembly outer membrane protein LptD (OstA)
VADRLEGGRTAAEGEIITLIGNVMLTRDGTVVKSQTGRYVKRDGTIYLTGGVDAVDGSAHITALSAAYNEQNDLITLTGQVIVRDKDMVLSGDYGSYDQAEGRAELWSRVTGRDKARTLVAERVTYLRDRELAQARGHVTARDSTEGITLTAGSVDYDRQAQIALATDGPKLVQRPKDGKGPVTLYGDTITVHSKERIANADGHVRVLQDSLEATAGRAVFYDRENRGLLLDGPRATTSEVSVRGDTLEAFTKGKDLERLRVRSAGVIDYRGLGKEANGDISTLTADRMEIWLSGNAVDSLWAEQNAANEFTGAPVPGRRSEMNRTQGALMRLYFKDKELQRAIVTGGAKGDYRAESDLADSAAADRDRVAYEAGRITFEVPKDRIRLEDDAHLSYQELSLQSPQVIFDSKRQVFEARGNPVLEDRGDTLRGRTLTYDLGARKGAVYGARTRYESGWYSGERIRRLGDSVLDVQGATYSTCNLLHPHYAFESDRMKIYLKDKVIARPLVFAVRGIPLLALPFWVFPIRDERHSGMLVPQIQFGFSGPNGFVRNAGYYWAPNDYTDFTFSGDYYPAIPSWQLHGQARYKLLYRFEGQIEGSYARQIDETGQRAGDLYLHHYEQFGDKTTLTADGRYTSSAAYNQSSFTGNPLAQRVDRFMTSNLTLNHRRPWATINLFLSRREDLEPAPTAFGSVPRVEQQLPSLSIGFPTRTLGHKAGAGKDSFLPFLSTTYLAASARFVNQHNINVFLEPDSLGNPAQAETTDVRSVYQQQFTLSDSRRLFGFVNVGPAFRTTQVVFDHDVTGKSPSAGATWGVGGSASMTVYGTSKGGIGPVTSFRHVFNPSVAYSYQPDFPSLRVQVPLTDSTFATVNRFPSVAGIGLSGAQQSFLSFSLANRFEAKVKSGDREKSLSNLLSINFTSAYDFLWRQSGRSTPWRPITTTVRIQPPSYVSGDLTLSHDLVYDKPLRTAQATIGLRFSGGGATSSVTRIPLAGNEAQTARPTDPLIPWNLSTSFSYSGSRSANGPWSHREFANAVLGLRPTPNWELNYYNQIDLSERRIVAQEYALTRNLHCWKLQFVRRFSGGTADYYFRIGIVDRPEIFYDRGTTGIGTFGGVGSLPGLGDLGQ